MKITLPPIKPISELKPLPAVSPLSKKKKKKKPVESRLKVKPLAVPKKKSAPVKDPRKYIDTYFGVRNGIQGHPVEGTNYTLETLTYMTSHNRADEITEIIIEEMKNRNKDHFPMFECCAGIGGNTMSFLDNDKIDWVVSYEILPDRRKMLIANLLMYNLTQGNRSFIPEEGFQGVPKKYKGVVLYMDPPWLPSTIKGHESEKEQYVLSGIKVGGKTLEEWTNQCLHCSLIVLRVPPGYKIDKKQLPDFDVTERLVKNSLLIIISPRSSRGGKQKKLPYEKPVSQLPAKIEVVDYTDEKKWEEGLKKYIRDELLALILPSPELREKMVGEKEMEIWKKAFTHETYNPNVGENYEELELYGDRVMDVNWIKWLRQKIKHINRQQLSELRTVYLSKPFQAELSQRLGLGKWARTKSALSTHILEDLLESMFGALERNGDMAFKFGAGMGLAYNMIVYLFKDVKIDLSLAVGRAKTQIKEMFEGLWGKDDRAIETSEEGPDKTTIATVSVPDVGVRFFRSKGIPINNPVLATEIGTTKKVAFIHAYSSALKRLRELGVTDEWVRQNKINRNLPLIEYQQAVISKLQSQGMVDYTFSKAYNTRFGKYILLIGILPDGSKRSLTLNKDPAENVLTAKKMALEAYLAE